MLDPDMSHSGQSLNQIYVDTVLRERDLIMASNLYREAQQPGIKRVVAVVGANHVPGIIRNWRTAATDEASKLYETYMQ